MSEQEVFDTLKYRIEDDTRGTRRYRNVMGQLHRENGPAIIWNNGAKEWWQNGQRHRIDGPAIEWRNGVRFWYVNGERLTKAAFNQAINHYE